MNSRTVLTLAVGLASLVAVLLVMNGQDNGGDIRGELLFEGLREDINTLQTVTITGPGGEVAASLTPAGARWEVAERSYPGHAGQLRQLLLALAEARLIEAKTANAAYYSRLGVEDVSAENAGGVLVEIQAAANHYAVIIGDQVRGEYRYIRRPDEAGSWLIDRSPEAPRRTSDWLDPGITDINAASVHAVRIQHPDGQTINLAKASPADSNFTVFEIPQGEELLYAGVANAIGGVLDNLSLDDVAAEPAQSKQAVRTTFKTFDGRIVEISAVQISGQPWIQVAASYDSALAARFAPPSKGTAEADGPPMAVVSADAPPGTEIQSQVAALNKRAAGKRYQIPQFKYEQLTRRWNDLLKQDAQP
jgi:hypothetical protein